MDLRTAGIVLFVIFFFGLCIFVHELGHFLAARWRRLHIVAFSIGFVKAWSWQRGGIEYRIGWLPFGGYVDLPQIDATGQPKDEDGNPLPRAKPTDRIATAFAGPLCNLLFGFAIGAFLWWHGIPQDTPKMSEIVIAELEQDSPEYQAGLRQDDRIVRVNGKSFYGTWNDWVREIIFTVGDVQLEVMREGKPLRFRYRPAKNRARLQGEDIAYPFFIPRVPLIVQVRPDSAVAAAGMCSGDEVVEVNGQRMTRHGELVMMLQQPGIEVFNFTLRRGGKMVTLPPVKPEYLAGKHVLGVVQDEALLAAVARLGGWWRPLPEALGLRPGDRILRVNGKELAAVEDLETILAAAPDAPLNFEIEREGKTRTVALLAPPKLDAAAAQKNGAEAKDNPQRSEPPAAAVGVKISYQYVPPVVVTHVFPGSVAEAAGLRAGDQLVAVDGRPIRRIEDLPAAVQAKYAPAPWWRRLLARLGMGRTEATAVKSLELRVRRDGQELVFPSLVAKRQQLTDLGLSLIIFNHPTPWRQLVDTVVMSYKSVRGIFANLLFGSSTLKARHLSGPIGIARGIFITVERGGVIPALSLVVMITFSLAILNLMPFPVLDGGHIVMALYEQWFGKPLSARLVQPLFSVFVVLLISLMVYVTYFDVLRIMPRQVSRDYWLRPAPAAAAAEQSDSQNPAGGGTSPESATGAPPAATP